MPVSAYIGHSWPQIILEKGNYQLCGLSLGSPAEDKSPMGFGREHSCTLKGSFCLTVPLQGLSRSDVSPIYHRPLSSRGKELTLYKERQEWLVVFT